MLLGRSPQVNGFTRTVVKPEPGRASSRGGPVMRGYEPGVKADPCSSQKAFTRESVPRFSPTARPTRPGGASLLKVQPLGADKEYARFPRSATRATTSDRRPSSASVKPTSPIMTTWLSAFQNRVESRCSRSQGSPGCGVARRGRIETRPTCVSGDDLHSHWSSSWW